MVSFNYRCLRARFEMNSLDFISSVYLFVVYGYGPISGLNLFLFSNSNTINTNLLKLFDELVVLAMNRI